MVGSLTGIRCPEGKRNVAEVLVWQRGQAHSRLRAVLPLVTPASPNSAGALRAAIRLSCAAGPSVAAPKAGAFRLARGVGKEAVEFKIVAAVAHASAMRHRAGLSPGLTAAAPA